MRVLLLSDTHIGLDMPARPRVHRRRRGPDFVANLKRALAPALRGEVDLVVHAGDLFDTHKVSASVAKLAYDALGEVAEAGVPVVITPGNHERSELPHSFLATRRNVHLFAGPSTFECEVDGVHVAVAGFPFQRRFDRETVPGLVRATGVQHVPAGIKLLVVHQAVEGAQVAAWDYTFRPGKDVLAGNDVPRGFAAILGGHIHRRQILTVDLRGRPLPAPVVYPGSIERVSFAERYEEKGFARLVFTPDDDGGRLAEAVFEPLPTRPMVVVRIRAQGLSGPDLKEVIATRLAALDPDSVVRLKVEGPLAPGGVRALTAAQVRALGPATMNVSLPRASTRKNRAPAYA